MVRAVYLVAMRYGNPLVFRLDVATANLDEAVDEAMLRAHETGRTHVVYSIVPDGKTRPAVVFESR